MKKLTLLAAGLVFGLAIYLAPVSVHTPAPVTVAVPSNGVILEGQAWLSTAHAQVINYEVILTTLRDMQVDIGRMIVLVEKHRDGSVHVGDEDVTLSAAQKTQIISRYTALKTGLAAKYQTLP